MVLRRRGYLFESERDPRSEIMKAARHLNLSRMKMVAKGFVRADFLNLSGSGKGGVADALVDHLSSYREDHRPKLLDEILKALAAMPAKGA